jgi:hypothetical protein
MHCVSLGFNCNVALSLKKCKLNKETNIFDYLVSHPKDILYILENNVEDFCKDYIFLDFSMSKQKYIITNNNKTNRIYDKNNNLIFSHDYHYDINNSIIVLQNKYKRRIHRLQNILLKGKKILFIFSGKTNHSDYLNDSHSILTFENKSDSKTYYLYLQKISEYLQNTYPYLNFHILTFNLYNKFEDFEIFRKLQ